MKTGDLVTIECEGRTVDGWIILASKNGASLMLGFEAMLGGHVGMMPVLRDKGDRYHSIMDLTEVIVRPRDVF